MSKFLITKRGNGEFQFKLIADNGQIILSSESYSSKVACENGIESTRTNSQDSSKYDRKTSSNGKFYFNIKAANGQIIGTSELYETEDGRENGITIVKELAFSAPIEEETK